MDTAALAPAAGRAYHLVSTDDGQPRFRLAAAPEAAHASAAGLMSSSDYQKMRRLKPVEELPAALAALTPQSTDEDIRAALRACVTGGDYTGMEWYVLVVLGAGMDGTAAFSAETTQYYKGLTPVVGSMEADEGLIEGGTFRKSGRLATHLRWLGASGGWEGISIRCDVTHDDTSGADIFAYSCAAPESDAGEYLLPDGLLNLGDASTSDDIKAVLDPVADELKQAIRDGKTLAFRRASSGMVYDKIILNVQNAMIMGSLFTIPLAYYSYTRQAQVHIVYASATSRVEILYLSPYQLPAGLYTLSGSGITSQELQDALAGREGATYQQAKTVFDQIARAIRLGRRLQIRNDSSGAAVLQADVLGMVMYASDGSAAAMVSLLGTGYGLFGGIAWGSLLITDDGSSFSANNNQG